MLPAPNNILEAITDAFIAIHKDGRVVYVNIQAEILLRLDREELLDCDLWEVIPEWASSDFFEQVAQAYKKQSYLEVDQFHSLSQRWFGFRIFSQDDILHIYFRDVTDRKRSKETREQVHITLQHQVRSHTNKLELLNEQLLHDSLHDALTSLPNRTYLMDSLRRAMADSSQIHSILFLDFDGFKLINDSLGPRVGDELLIALSGRLTNQVRPSEIVARLGGDDFAILLSSAQSLEQILAVVERIQGRLNRPFAVQGYELYLSASIGVVFNVASYSFAEDVLRDADLAMYNAKSLGKGNVSVFDKALREQRVNRLTLEADLRLALERNELRVHFQPIIDLVTLLPVGFETLVRWQHPTRGFIPPDAFISIAEDSGLIDKVDLWVVREACKQLKVWQQTFPHLADLKLNVNFSGRDFAKADLLDHLQDIFESTSFLPQNLNIEITETILMDDTPHTLKSLTQIRELGVQLHIDDFGTGYSSLSYLQRFSAQGLKIDRSFIAQLETSERNSELVRALISMAHSLNMDVVAEGIETAEQLSLLRELGCDFAQGYYMSKPMKAEDTFAYLMAVYEAETAAA